MRYAQIRSMDISDGPGIRVALYTQGCNIRCPGCHNESIWDYNGGAEFTLETANKILDLCEPEYIAGLSILGGEPLSLCNAPELLALVQRFKQKFPNKTVWLWTGYVLDEIIEQCLSDPARYYFLHTLILNLDVVVDGPWKKELFDINLKYRGSSNQRVIDMKQTIKKNRVILYKE